MKTPQKISRLFIANIFLFCCIVCFAQPNLADSQRRSSEMHIYKISKDDLRKIHLRSGSFNEGMLKDYVTKYKIGDKMPILNRGNYVRVSVIDNQLNYAEIIIDDLYAKIIPSEKFVVCLYDSLGRIISDAKIKKGASKLKYDKETQTYRTKKVKDEQVIEIAHNGVYHYLEVTDNQYDHDANFFSSAWWKIKSWWNKTKYSAKSIFHQSGYSIKQKYTGFIVFNKPKYKPGEKVKLKAYLAQHNGKRHNKPIDIRLKGNYYRADIDTILTRLHPYQPGMYNYEFELTEGLNLILDKKYSISLVTDEKKSNQISANFTYEDYELKSINFSLKSDKQEYAMGDSIKLNMKATDENNMPVYDGRVEVLITQGNFDQNKINKMEPVFIPDTLWNQTINMFGVSEKELLIPDSIFPSDMNLNFTVKCTYLSADNEKHTESLSLTKTKNKYTPNFSLNKGMLTIKELHLGKSQPTMAEIVISGEYDECLYKDSVMLPHTLAVPWHANDVAIKTKDTKECHFSIDNEDEQLGYSFYRNNDSIYLKVDNPANIPFWYTVRKKKKEIHKGYTTQLNYAIKDIGEDGYSMQLAYRFGQKSKSIEASLPFIKKNITIDVTTPTAVYPGQKANVLVNVSDKKGKPVKDADITAYSFTSKFKNYLMPYIPIGGKARYAKQFHNALYAMDDDFYTNAKSNLTWDKWVNAMALDTIEYYKFLYPDTFYLSKTPTNNQKTLISPFVVINGVVQDIYMLWIDERLYYTNRSEHLNVYSFEIDPGKHSLRFRTYNRETLALNVYLEKGKNHIMSFNGEKSYTKIPYEDIALPPLVLTSELLNKKEWGYLSNKEESELLAQLITIDNNFGEINLPVINQSIEIPGYIDAGGTLYYLNHTNRTAYNTTLKTRVRTPILTGPFPKKYAVEGTSDIVSIYAENDFLTNIEPEGGNHYTLYPNYQKIKQWDKSPINRRIPPLKPALDFKQQPLTKAGIENRIKEKTANIMHSASGFVNIRQYGKKSDSGDFQLNLFLRRDTTGASIKPTLIFIEPKKEENRKDYQLYYGGTRYFNNLPTEELTIHLIFKDSTSYSYPLKLYKGGKNYLKLDSIAVCDKSTDIARIAYNLFNAEIKRYKVENPYIAKSVNAPLTLSPISDKEEFKKENKNKQIITGTVRDASDPIIGATVKILGTDKAAITDFDGKFEIKVEDTAVLEVIYIGYNAKEVKVSVGHHYNIVLKESENRLEEVVVVGYGTMKKKNLTGSIVSVQDNTSLYSVNQALQGRIRGLESVSVKANDKPLIIVNGLPFEGDLDNLDKSTILSLKILKDADATSIYGTKAANGAIIIETNNPSPLYTTNENGNPNEEPGNTMRRNFHDDAFWQPKLKTNDKGEVKFEVTYPDDITNWNAYFVALGGKNQSDTKQINIKSFKSLTAHLSTPRYAVRGDSLNAIGKITNHFGDSLQLTRTIELDNNKVVDKMKIGKSHVDCIPLNVTDSDSLSLAYFLQTENSYFDGEERSFPIFEQGMLQTHGDFKIINDSSTYTLNTNPLLGAVTIHAEASCMELFLREIENIDRYPYMCNEQMASKIKALLAKKHILKLQGEVFKEDKKINSLIKELNKNRNKEGLWGWWNKSKSIIWISKHIINTLLDAEEAGYKIDLDKQSLAATFEQELKDGLASLPLTVNPKPLLVKDELLDKLILLKRLGAPVDYKTYLYNINSQLESQTVKDKLKIMQVMSAIGLRDSIKVDSLMHYSNKTILGSRYWGDTSDNGPSSRRYFYRPYETNTESTLSAYEVLRNIGGYEKELESIRNYFFERRQNNTWNNIYETSRIVQTIMPDMLKDVTDRVNVSMNINGSEISKFPYTTKTESAEKIRVSKTGSMPLFITAYQRDWNQSPAKEEKKGFRISTVFKINKDSIANLTEGKSTILETTLDVEGDAEYIQIEIPIPAGCTYESKSNGDYWKEAHREYYKEKVVIFCNRLSKGQHIFTVELLPKFTGRYTLNPAKAELMYFPTFYGNEKAKTILINQAEY